MDEYTPTVDEVCEGYVHNTLNPVADAAEFDRWLTTYEATIRADQIEKDAALAVRVTTDSPYHFQDHSDEIIDAIRAQLTQQEEGK